MSDTGSGSNYPNNSYYDYSEYYAEEFNSPSPCNDTEMREIGQAFLPTLYCLVFGLGLAGNGLVVCVLVKHRNQINLTDICLFNLALSDLLFVLTLPFYAHYSAVSQWIFRDFMCRFISMCSCTAFFSSSFFMVVMTLDRYLIIMQTHKVAKYRTARAGIALSMSVWMLSMCVSLPAFIFTKVTNDDNAQNCSCALENGTFKIYNTLAANILGLAFPLLVMVVCYSRIIPTLLNMRSAKKHRVVKLIISIVATFFLFWAPYNIILFLKLLQTKGDLRSECEFNAKLRLSFIVTETFAFSHCCLNPIIYALVGQKFMKRALQLLSNCMPGILFASTRDMSDTSFRKSSAMSRSSDVTPTVIM